MAIMDFTTIVVSVASIVMTVLTLTSCGQPASTAFDKWYEAVINEPYDPMNGSKY